MERTRLVLTRKNGQSVWIGDARVNFEVRGKVVKLVIESPKDVRIVREEVKARAA